VTAGDNVNSIILTVKLARVMLGTQDAAKPSSVVAALPAGTRMALGLLPPVGGGKHLADGAGVAMVSVFVRHRPARGPGPPGG